MIQLLILEISRTVQTKIIRLLGLRCYHIRWQEKSHQVSSQVSYWKDKIELYIVKVRAVLNRRRHQVELRVRLSNSSQAVLHKTYLVYLALVVLSSTIWKTLTVRLISTPRQNAVVISHFCRCAANVYGEFCSREGYLGIFAGYVPPTSQIPTPFKSTSWPVIDPILVTFGQM